MPLSDKRGVPAGLSRSSGLAAGAATSERFHDAAAARRAIEHRVVVLHEPFHGYPFGADPDEDRSTRSAVVIEGSNLEPECSDPLVFADHDGRQRPSELASQGELVDV